MKYVGIDPGTLESGWVVTEEYKPIKCGKSRNEFLREMLINSEIVQGLPAVLVIEKPVCRLHAGAEVSEAAIWTGIFMGSWPDFAGIKLMTRQAVRMHMVGKTATDAKITQEIIKRFRPEWLKDFKSDIWQAYALVVSYLDGIQAKGKI